MIFSGRPNKLSILVISCCLWVSAGAQSPAETLDFAHRQYEAGQFEQALRAYQRVLFFHDLASFPRAELYHQIARCHYAMEDYPEAVQYYELAFSAYTVDSLKREMIFLKSHALLKQRKFQFALLELLSLPKELPVHADLRRHFYLSTAYYGTDNFEQCRFHLQFLIRDSTDRQQLDRLIKKAEKTGRINPKVARTLSIIVPGMGQFYAGAVKEGFNSLLLTSSFLVLTLTTAATYTVFDALVAVFPWYLRYYQGGIKNAEDLARERSAIKKSKVFDSLMDLLLRPDRG